MLHEVPEGIVITRPQDLLRHPNKTQLVLCTSDKLADYLVCYLERREAGKPLKQAHEEAMKYLGFQTVKPISSGPVS